LADAIVDVVSTGGTLKANHLVEVEEIAPISARLVVNQASLKTRAARLEPLLARLAQVVAQRAGAAASLIQSGAAA
jgi:ATP phosphoribosyltransferase